MMSSASKKTTILCMLSGGIDSTGVLHQLITSDHYKQHNIIVHHIHLFNRENRSRAEAIAVNKILSYYRYNSDRKFLTTESTFDTTGFAPLRSTRFPFDMDVCAFMAGNICAARGDVGFVAMGRTKTDIDSGGTNFQDRMNRAQGIFQQVLLMQPDPKPQYIFPVAEYTKEEIWNFLPEEVRKSTWWCRRPVYRNQIPEPCNQCQTCKEVNKFLHG